MDYSFDSLVIESVLDKFSINVGCPRGRIFDIILDLSDQTGPFDKLKCTSNKLFFRLNHCRYNKKSIVPFCGW